MAEDPGLQTEKEWYTDDMDNETLVADEEFELDEPVENDAEDDSLVELSGDVPVWRLIEMSREDRFLERELADFADYDVYDADFVGNGFSGYAN